MTAVITHRSADSGRRYRNLLGVCRRRGRWAAVRIRRVARARGRSDAGMTTAEYAVGTLGACALAATLYKVVTSPAILDALTGLLDRALHAT
ncbi:DUF4244 domain-containing protein [Kitasatospora sp. NPDC091207]|uniref:DUF4244 domain-containing protein n=1 Tax=Kitasatospora sp. NPDC091207 TaxID=3364083 RepID=UPI003814CADC